MYFTQEDYKKIENWLHRNSVKDTEFQEALPFTGKEIVTVVQDGHNRKVNIQEFINQLYKHGVEDFLNVTNTYRANNITLKEAIRLIPAEARKEGQVITFLNTEGNWEIYQFTGKLNQWNNTTLWNNPFDWEKFVVDSILPDEEDLTKSEPDAKGNSYLSLKNRKYEPDKYSGLGRKILRRRVVEIEDPIYGTQEKNLLLQADFAEDNTVYVVRYDFTLNGQDITLPDNSYIEYEGGSISDGNIIDRAGGLNKVVLKKNIVNGVNTLTQDMISTTNTKYVIKYDYVLGEDITITDNCVLEFDGGSFTGNSLTGNNTFVDINQSTPVFNNIKMLGSFHTKEFPLNLYNTTKIDYLYTLLQSFSGTNFVLNANYSVTETDNTVDGTTPHTLNIDGNGYKLTLHSFGAYNMTRCSIKNITIEAQNNSVGSWHSDIFKFGLLGYNANSTLDVHNVTFTSDVAKLYMRSFKSINISNCFEDGVYFYVASTHCVTVKNCRVINATGGYKQINDSFTPNDEDFTIIDNCYFKNLSSFGIILTGGIKMNPSVTNCKLINVGSGGAEKACINMHPKGVITIKNNYIAANVDASTLDIDAAREDMFSDDTVAFVENNILRNVTGDTTIHGMALVGLRKLYLRNNNITDQKFSFWDTVDMECVDNIFSYTDIIITNFSIASTTTHDFTVNYTYNHYYKNNIINIKGHLSYIHWSYDNPSTKGNIYGIRNLWNDTDFVVNPANLNIYGDIYVYDKNYVYSKQILKDNVYLSGVKNNELCPIGLKRYNPKNNTEIRGSILGQVDNYLNPVGTVYIGNTASRPTLCLPGTAYFDTTLNKMIYAQGTKAKLDVQITGPLTSPDGSLVSDKCIVYMKNMTIVCDRKTTTEIGISSIFEYFEGTKNEYKYFKDLGLLSINNNWNTYTKTIQCIYVGEIGDDYGVVHSNTVNGFTTNHNLVNDGTISWVDATGANV